MATHGPKAPTKLLPESGDNLRPSVRHNNTLKSVNPKKHDSKPEQLAEGNLAEGSLDREMKCRGLENLSTIVSTAVLPSERENLVT